MKLKLRKSLAWLLTVILGIVGGLALGAILEALDERRRRKKVVD